MPNIKSAIKRVRVTEKNAKENASIKKSSLAKELNTIK